MRERREWQRRDRWRQLGKTSSLLPTKSWRPGSPQITNYLHGLQNKRENNFPEVQVQDKPPLKCPQQENKGLCLLDGQTQTDAVVSLNKGRETDDAAGNFLLETKLSLFVPVSHPEVIPQVSLYSPCKQNFFGFEKSRVQVRVKYPLNQSKFKTRNAACTFKYRPDLLPHISHIFSALNSDKTGFFFSFLYHLCVFVALCFSESKYLRAAGRCEIFSCKLGKNQNVWGCRNKIRAQT